MISALKLVQTEVQPAAVIRLTIPREQIQEAMCPAMTELLEAVAAQGIGLAGPAFSHHFKVDPAIFDFEVGVPVTNPVTPTGRVQAGELPAARVIRTVFTGDYSGLGEAWGLFMEQVHAAGYRPAPNAWEVYLAGPDMSDDPADWHTELNRPLQD